MYTIETGNPKVHPYRLFAPPQYPPWIFPCFRHLAHVSYLFGRIGQAVSHQKQGLLASERVLGVDHYETIYCYVYLALFTHNLAQTCVALRLMYRAKYLLKLIFGPDHLEQAAFDVRHSLLNVVNYSLYCVIAVLNICFILIVLVPHSWL